MQRLTKEQRDWLIEKFKHSIKNVDLPTRACWMDHYTRTINQCTEKKFPYLRMEVSDQGSIELNGSIHRDSHVTMATNFKNINGSVACIDLNHHEFKLFAEGCNKIVEYLNAET